MSGQYSHSAFPTNARQSLLFPDRQLGLYLVAVRADGRPSRVEGFEEFEPMEQAARAWLCNDAIAWVALGHRKRWTHGWRCAQTHIMVRRGEEILIKEQAGRLQRVARTRIRSRDMAAPV